jgi:hypothetical protein
MATFNPSNGSVSGTGSDGYGFTWTPPFTSQAQIDSYMQALQGVSSLKKGGIINTGNFPESATLSAVATSTELPAVQVYNIANPPIFAIVYTDSNGASSFSYKNDPNNRIALVQNGSRINPIVSAASPTTSGSPITTGTVQQTSVDTVKQTYATSSTQERSGGGILGAICWCLSCMSSIGFVCFIGFLVYMALKKQP